MKGLGVIRHLKAQCAIADFLISGALRDRGEGLTSTVSQLKGAILIPCHFVAFTIAIERA